MKAIKTSILLLAILLIGTCSVPAQSQSSVTTQSKSSCQIHHPTLTTKQCNSVKAWVGMSVDQLHENWGLPDHVNRTSTQSGEYFQLVYTLGDKTDIVYFDNSNSVTTIQFETNEEERLEALERKMAALKAKAAREKAELAAKREWEAGEPARRAAEVASKAAEAEAAQKEAAKEAREQTGKAAAEAAHCTKLSDKTREALSDPDAIEGYEKYNKQNCGMIF